MKSLREKLLLTKGIEHPLSISTIFNKKILTNHKMKISLSVLLLVLIVLGFSNCKKETYETNGETIFRTGKNLQGEVLQDLAKSEMSGMVHGCANCHGDNGKGKFRGGGDRQTGSIAYDDLTNSALHTPIYTDSLIKRFIDSETKSNGTHANTGVVYVMSEKDKTDLIAFLKTL